VEVKLLPGSSQLGRVERRESHHPRPELGVTAIGPKVFAAATSVRRADSAAPAEKAGEKSKDAG
jgi:hypothetical protein